MSFRFALRRTLLVATSIFCILTVAELIKGHPLRAALGFSALWSAISTSVFIATLFYYSRKNIDCPICSDGPK